LQQRLELGAGVAIHIQVATEGVADLGVVSLAAGVLTEHEHVTLPAQLVHPRPVVPRHGEDQVGAVDELARQQPRSVAREIEPALEAHEIRPFGHRRPVPGPGAGGLPGKLADVDVTGSPSARTNLAIPRWEVQRTAMPPSGPRSTSGRRPLPPGSTSVSGPGQKARASALADSLNARPCASAISRSATSNRNGLPGRRPLRRATASTSGPRAREPRPYTVSVG